MCQSGYRSSTATSLIENAGFEHVSNVKGGTLAWIDGGLSTEASKSTAA
ncbi:MAG: rhodanese-like domain-containing protein [Acidobacteriota bacterium]